MKHLAQVLPPTTPPVALPTFLDVTHSHGVRPSRSRHDRPDVIGQEHLPWGSAADIIICVAPELARGVPAPAVQLRGGRACGKSLALIGGTGKEPSKLGVTLKRNL